MDGSVDEDFLSAIEYDKLKKERMREYVDKRRRYSLEDVAALMQAYQDYAEDYSAMWYDRSINLPSSKEWLQLNK